MSGPVLGSRDYYDALAVGYDYELERRSRYVDAIDERVIHCALVRGANTILDVGCGNGRRLASILHRTGMRGTGIDESGRMVEEARRLGVSADVVNIADAVAVAARLKGDTFDLVTALWNVLGHMPGYDERRRALDNMRSLVAAGGAVILDVNNRYNVAQYGWWPVLRNVVVDHLRPGTAGDFVVRRRLSGRDLATITHVFSPPEIRILCVEAGLQPIEVRYIDYDTGELRGPRSGQLFVVAEAAP